MKTVLKIQIGDFFRIDGEFGIAGFLRINASTHEGNNAHCINSANGTFEKGKSYFILHDVPVV